MSVLSSTHRRRRRMPNKVKFKSMGDHDEFLRRIKKTLYYGKIPLTERFSLPVSELAAELYSNVRSEHGLDRLCIDETADVSRNACVSPCSLILALFYLERLKTCNLDYIDRVPPTELFVASTMIASKFLHDDGEEDEVFNTEWANSAGIEVSELNRYEKDFLNAINWEVYVNEAAFWAGLSKLEKEVARREGRRRGWFTYTELLMMSDFVDAWSLAQTLVMVSVVCLTSYTAGMLTLVGSAIITSQLASVIPTTTTIISPQTTHLAPFTPSSGLPTENETVIFSEDRLSELETACRNGTCFESLTELKDAYWRLTRPESTGTLVTNLLSLTSVWHELGKSVDNICNRLYRAIVNDNKASLISLNETKLSLMNAVKMMIVAIETEKSKSYGAVDLFIENVDYDGSTVTIPVKNHVTGNSFNQLSYFLRTLKLPS